MAEVGTKTNRMAVGNKWQDTYTLTNVQNDSSSTVTTSMRKIDSAVPVINKVTGDYINVVSVVGGVITLDATSSNDDGQIIVTGV